MSRTPVTPCAHVWRFLQCLRVKHKGYTSNSETTRYRYICNKCSLVELSCIPPSPKNEHA